VTETPAAIKAANARLSHLLESGPDGVKQAADSMSDYTRTRMRESGFCGKFLPWDPITYSDLTPQLNQEAPVKLVEREPESPGAITIPFGQTPRMVSIRGLKYIVGFDRLVSPWMSKDVVLLGTYEMDIRQIVTDNAFKDMLAEDDAKFLEGVTTAIGGVADVPSVFSNTIQWKTIYGGVDRDGLYNAKSLLLSTPQSFPATKALVNVIFLNEVAKLGREEVGGDLSQQFFRDGFAEEHFLGLDWVATIKRKLVPDNTMFLFTDPSAIGKAYELEPVTMFVERKAFLLTFFAYQTKGAGIGNTAGLGRVDFR
jgi:hypothetical protein